VCTKNCKLVLLKLCHDYLRQIIIIIQYYDNASLQSHAGSFKKGEEYGMCDPWLTIVTQFKLNEQILM